MVTCWLLKAMHWKAHPPKVTKKNVASFTVNKHTQDQMCTSHSSKPHPTCVSASHSFKQQKKRLGISTSENHVQGSVCVPTCTNLNHSGVTFLPFLLSTLFLHYAKQQQHSHHLSNFPLTLQALLKKCRVEIWHFTFAWTFLKHRISWEGFPGW